MSVYVNIYRSTGKNPAYLFCWLPYKMKLPTAGEAFSPVSTFLFKKEMI